MSLLMTVVVAIKALQRNAMRTALTALGLIIGVAAVIVMMALGNGAQSAIEAQIRDVGSDLITVNAGAGGFGPVRGGAGGTTTLTIEDADAIRREIRGVRFLSPGVATRVQVVGGTGNWNTTIQGANPELEQIRAWPTQFGGYFTERDVEQANRVALLGVVVRDQLFGPGADPTGQMIRIRNQPFRITGVLTRKGQAALGQDRDDTIVIPYTTAMKRLLGQDYLRDILIAAAPGSDVADMTRRIEGLLRERHRILPGEEDDFFVRTLDEIVSVLTTTTTTMKYLLASIASVSLLVGGIGIMNIMLVSVTERTREIGLRLSVGARASDVLLQFLTEAVVLSLAGGALGVVLGFAGSLVVGRIMAWASLVTADAVFLSVGCATAVGIFFGFYPARKAAQLDPVDALRYE